MNARLLIGAAIAAAILTRSAATAADTFDKIGTYTWTYGARAVLPPVTLAHSPTQHTTGQGEYWIIGVKAEGSTAPGYDYYILFGGDPRDSSSVGQAKIVNSKPPTGNDPQRQELLVISGVAYFLGTYPYGGTSGGSGIGEGTKFLVWVRPTLPDYFVYLEEDSAPHSLKVYTRTNWNQPPKVIQNINWYLLVSDGVPGDPLAVNRDPSTTDDDDRRDVTWRMVLIASAAGLEKPLPY